MELELDLGSGEYDDESVVWELDLGDNSLLADSPPDADSELELVLPSEPPTGSALSFTAGPPAKRQRVLAHAEPCAGIVASVAAATPATKVSSRGSFHRGSGSEYWEHVAFRRDNGLVDAQGRWTYSQALRALGNTLPPLGFPRP